MSTGNSIKQLRRIAPSIVRASPWRTALAQRARGRVVVGRRMRLIGARNVTVAGGVLKLGTGGFSFTDTRMPGMIRIRGRLQVDGSVSVAPGARWDIEEGATLRIGDETYFTAATIIVAMNSITFGARCAIAWQTQFLDDDLHTLHIDGAERPRSAPIVIGDDVWIGSRATILKGTRIAPGCIVAAGSVVNGHFDEPHCLIAGTPARVVKRGVRWQFR